MAQVSWTVEATADLDGIRNYVSAFDSVAASNLVRRLVAAALSLEDYPRRGRLAGHGLRALTTIWPYLILYEIEDERVRILSVRHGARRSIGE